MTHLLPYPPVVGLLGGIASGKSFVSRLLADLGCLVISADELVAECYRDPAVIQTLRAWWGPDILKPDGTPDRSAIAKIIFSDPGQRRRLEALLHPRVIARRREIMAAARPAPRAFVWDVPLLVETDQHRDCDALLFIDTPLDVRQHRAAARGWNPDELLRREQAQLPLSHKKNLATHVLPGTLPAPDLKARLEQLLASLTPPSLPPSSPPSYPTPAPPTPAPNPGKMP